MTAMTAGRVAVLVGVAALVVPSWMVPVRASANDPVRPRAAVVVSAADGTDPFVTAYLSEVGAEVLREAGFDVAPPNAAREALIRTGHGALECAADDVCVAAFARQVAAPTLLFVQTAPISPERITVAIASVTVRHGGIERSEPSSGEGGEAQMAEPVQAAARALDVRERPCQVDLAVGGGLDVSVSVAGGAPITELPLFLPAGPHELTFVARSARDRTDARATLTCVAGHRYRVRVR